MEDGANITAEIFSAYLKCPTKAYLATHGEKPQDPAFAEMRKRISAAYKAIAIQSSRTASGGIAPIDFLRLSNGVTCDAATVDCETALYSCESPASDSIDWGARGGGSDRPNVPIVYSAWEKSDQSDNLLVCFGALALAQATGTEIPPRGKVVYGQGHRIKTVRIPNHLPKTRRIVEEIASACFSKEPPPLVLNAHCPTCDFQSRCRALAIERDDLSLLGAMTAKERIKYQEKGISTVTNLSYGYRPRRRKRKQTIPAKEGKPSKNDHKLKALAIKKAQIHIVGSPSLSIEGTPVFIDVEGMADRSFYYLVGLRHEAQGAQVEQSFWANRLEDERDMWRDCLGAIKQIDNPQIIHYGAYESRFLKCMRERYQAGAEDAGFIDRLIDTSVNLLAIIYGRIYFPTYSNGLKDIARMLGFDWTWQQGSGTAAMLFRRCWELTSDDDLRRKLITYNIEDCRAAAKLTEALTRICANGEIGGAANLVSVNVGSLEVGFHRTFGKFASPMPEFEKINSAAYWDYQRTKVFVRTNKTLQRSRNRSLTRAKKVAVEKEVKVEDKPPFCSRCGKSHFWTYRGKSHVVFDLKFTRRGIKRWAIRYRYNMYRCSACRTEMTIYSRDSKYGPNLRAYVIYLLIEVRLSHQQAVEHVATVFNVHMLTTKASDIKSTMAKKYEPMYRMILEEIARGPLVHADETKGVVYGGGHYIWVFANMTSVAYVYSASRNASVLNDILAEFKGVLVSDFYGGYDGMPCRQQKCLIHLMRDINEDILKHPFNEELTFVAKRFGALLREIVATIDAYGLKRRHLQKHRRSAERFLDDVAALQCTTEVSSSLQKRINKNRDRLFTFLDYNDVPWNNNNAEHAIRAFTRLRNVMVTSTPKGTSEYCVLLSVQQTLRCRGIGFLDFLRSGRSTIESLNGFFRGASAADLQ
jgi:predicted RecB family nuclease